MKRTISERPQDKEFMTETTLHTKNCYLTNLDVQLVKKPKKTIFSTCYWSSKINTLLKEKNSLHTKKSYSPTFYWWKKKETLFSMKKLLSKQKTTVITNITTIRTVMVMVTVRLVLVLGLG
jgi:hypothetical protein